jgi:ParB family chromosome partitioning protein
LAQEIRELRRLAAAIAQHGLINPITLRPAELGENRYILVTGERRYWAHVLLNLEGRQIQEGEEVQTPDHIKATLVPPGASIRAHQIVENLMREDINVVEKAHGLWALRRELSNDAHGRHFDTEKGKKSRLVSWKQVEDALDMSRQYRARIMSVLDLSEEAREMVDRYNLTERTIRPIVEKLKSYPDLQMQALRQLVKWQEAEAKGEGDGRRIVPSVQALVDKLLATSDNSTTKPFAELGGTSLPSRKQCTKTLSNPFFAAISTTA